MLQGLKGCKKLTMEEMMRDFTEVTLSDHEFAAWLSRMNALDWFEHVGKSCQWRNPRGRIVAIAIYDNTTCTRKTFIPTGPEE